MTTYQAPPTFAQGDFPMAAQLNILGDDVAVVYGLLFHNAVSPCVRALPAGASHLVVKRRLDWLHYRTREAGSGQSVSPRLASRRTNRTRVQQKTRMPRSDIA